MSAFYSVDETLMLPLKMILKYWKYTDHIFNWSGLCTVFQKAGHIINNSQTYMKLFQLWLCMGWWTRRPPEVFSNKLMILWLLWKISLTVSASCTELGHCRYLQTKEHFSVRELLWENLVATLGLLLRKYDIGRKILPDSCFKDVILILEFGFYINTKAPFLKVQRCDHCVYTAQNSLRVIILYKYWILDLNLKY